MIKLIIIGSEPSIIHNHCIHNSLLLFNKFKNKFLENNIDIECFINFTNDDIIKLKNNIIHTDKYNNSIFIFHQLAGYTYLNKIDLNKKNIKKILIFNDTHTVRYINHKTLLYYDILLFNSLTFIKLFYTEYLKKVYLFPFSMDYDYISNISLDNRINKVLLYGKISMDIYPLRTKLYNIYKKNPKSYITIY